MLCFLMMRRRRVLASNMVGLTFLLVGEEHWQNQSPGMWDNIEPLGNIPGARVGSMSGFDMTNISSKYLKHVPKNLYKFPSVGVGIPLDPWKHRDIIGRTNDEKVEKNGSLNVEDHNTQGRSSFRMKVTSSPFMMFDFFRIELVEWCCVVCHIRIRYGGGACAEWRHRTPVPFLKIRSRRAPRGVVPSPSVRRNTKPVTHVATNFLIRASPVHQVCLETLARPSW